MRSLSDIAFSFSTLSADPTANAGDVQEAEAAAAVADPVVPEAEDAAEEGDCPFCFLTPCVTAHPHHFLGAGQAACAANSGNRRVRYGHYWKVISNMNGWRHTRYLAKKRQVGEFAVYHRREIMPECVLTQVRDLYPNPPGQAYMGHKWE